MSSRGASSTAADSSGQRSAPCRRRAIWIKTVVNFQLPGKGVDAERELEDG